ncbi:MAG: regulatory protein RecX [Clostridiales bacterium]|nr:regulatory protein RecX [Clostridiales bacterium]
MGESAESMTDDGRVAEIRKIGKGRYLLSLESGLQFPLYRQELAECGISISFAGNEEAEEDSPVLFDRPDNTARQDLIPGEMLLKIRTEILPKRARLRAMRLLEKMDRTEAQLREKLRQSYYPDFIIDDAINYVKRYHYIDDLRYARNYLEIHAAAKSRRLMEQELYTKGVPIEVVEQAAAGMDFPDEEKQIRTLLEKKHYDFSCEDKKQQQRACSFLMRKGYSMSAILRVLRAAEE